MAAFQLRVMEQRIMSHMAKYAFCMLRLSGHFRPLFLLLNSLDAYVCIEYSKGPGAF